MTPETPDWRALFGVPGAPAREPAALALGVELRRRVRAGTSQWSPAKVQTATPRAVARAGADVLVGLRPMERSVRTDAWVKGSVSWDSLRRPTTRYDLAQARWFAELHSIGRDLRVLGGFSDVSEWLTLDDIGSRLLWPHLRAAEELGIPLVATQRDQTVALARSASVALAARRVEEGVAVAPQISIDGEEMAASAVRPIGRSGLYAFTSRGGGIDLVLAAVELPDPVAAVLGAAAEVIVPRDDADEFVTQHLPRIARQVAVAASGLVVPAAPRPVLVVHVAFEPRHRLTWRLRWRYGSDAPIEFDAAPTAERDAAAEDAIRAHVEALWNASSPVEFGAAGSLTDLDAADFSAQLLPALEEAADVVIDITGERPRYRELAGDPRIAITTVETDRTDWFDLGVVVSIEGRPIPFAVLFSALSKGRKRMLLSDGAYFSLSHPALQRLRDLIDESGALDEWEAGTTRISRHQTDFWADFEDLADEATPAVSWRATLDGLRELETIARTPPPAGLSVELRPYQRDGFEWLWFLWSHRLGGVLADDMGLGKTVQTLALMVKAREAGERRPFLVVAPTSVLSTWTSEAARFAPGLVVRRVEAGARGGAVTDAASAASVVVTSYTQLRRLEQQFAPVEWAAVVLDEAQFVKNPRTKTHRAAAALRADAVFALTGTPLENSLTELWSILALTAPGLFPSARRFREEYVQPIEEGRVPENAEGADYRARRLARLRRRIRPFLLRRTKELVASELPARQEQEVRIELAPAHRALYDAVLQRERQKVLGLLDDLDRHRFIVFRSLTLLRLLSLAPVLVDPAHSAVASSKLAALFAQLEEVTAEGHRALVFSQFTSFLQLVAAELDRRGIPYAYLDGSTRDRQAVIDGFREGEAPLFLISLRAGGFGLTLTEADYVFLLDPWWNPAVEAQAVDRAHRIGQTRSVVVYRLIAADTIEEKVLALQQRKARLFSAVMDDDELFGRSLSADDIRALFEEGPAAPA